MRRILILLMAAIVAVPACNPMDPSAALMDEIGHDWPLVREELERALPLNDEHKLGEWDLAIDGDDQERLTMLRDRDWPHFRVHAGSTEVVEFGRLLARL